MICYVAGKSGGHIVPALTLAVRDAQPALFFTTSSTLDAQIVHNNPAIAYWQTLTLSNFPRKNIFKYPVFFWQFTRACWQAFWVLRKHAPEKVVSFGGYVSIPVCLMAWVLRIPIELYELNVEPGSAVKILAPLASQLNIVFPEAAHYFKQNTVLVEYPVRFASEGFASALGADKYAKADARLLLGLQGDVFTILILGGSQGSAFMNNLAQKLPNLLTGHVSFQVIHQVGEKNVQELRNWYAQRGVKAIVFAYRQDLDVCYAAADIALARAGAGTLFELLYFKIPSIIIPLEAATTGHQVANAVAMAHHDPALFTVLRQSYLQNDVHAVVQAILAPYSK